MNNRVSLQRQTRSTTASPFSHANGNINSEASTIRLVNGIFAFSPVIVFSLLILLTAFTLTSHDIHLGTIRQYGLLHQSPSETPPTLLQLVSHVADALESYGITFWLMPGTGLLPGGRVTAWREGLDFGVNQTDVMRILLAQSEILQPLGIVAVESYFGLRLFPMSGFENPKFDFKTPFVDLLYFQQPRPDHIVNLCCDCEQKPTIIGVCTKRTCQCLVCALHTHMLFPLNKNFRIQGMDRDLPVPNAYQQLGIILPSNIPYVHPALFDDVRPIDELDEYDDDDISTE